MIWFQSHPIQYVSPLLRKLAINTPIEVFYYGGEKNLQNDNGFGQTVSWDIPLLDGYNHTFLKNAMNSSSMNTRFFDAINFGVFKVIAQSKSNTIILNGWAYCSDWFVIMAAFIFRKKIWLRSEMPWNQELMKPSSLKKSFKCYFFKWLVFRFLIDKFLYIGSQNKAYYINNGVIENRLIFAPYAVENERFQQCSDLEITNLRKDFGIKKNDVVVLFSGKFIDKKRPMDLLKAVQSISNAKLKVVFLGDGPLREQMTAFIAKHNMSNVIITGFVNQGSIPNYYHLADIFVMCSGVGETWGLSVNEAMNAGVPVIVSETCGSSYDLVNQMNGFTFKEGDYVTLAEKIDVLSSNQDLRTSMGQASLQLVQQFTHEQTVINLQEALTLGNK